MIGFFANTFGYILNFLYNIIQNYGLAIILFTILLKLVLLPLTIKQQKTMKKSAKIQEKLKVIQFKYKNDPQMLNQETMALYKNEKMNPLSGCFTAIIQLILLLSVFYLVSSPLTYMKKIDSDIIKEYKENLILDENGKTMNYPEISIIRENGSTDERVYINMNFLGLDLSNVPIQNLNNFTVYIIPILYVISSILSMKLSMNMNNKAKKPIKKDGQETELDTMDSMNKSMTYMMPIMSVMISFIAPLGLALYWLINNVLMILERVLITLFLEKNERSAEVDG